MGGVLTTSNMGTASSVDGLRWTNWSSAAGLDVQGDTSNNALWDAHLQRYLGFSRVDTQVLLPGGARVALGWGESGTRMALGWH